MLDGAGGRRRCRARRLAHTVRARRLAVDLLSLGANGLQNSAVNRRPTGGVSPIWRVCSGAGGPRKGPILSEQEARGRAVRRSVLVLALAGCSSDDGARSWTPGRTSVCDAGAAAGEEDRGRQRRDQRRPGDGSPQELQKPTRPPSMTCPSAYKAIGRRRQQGGARRDGDNGASCRQDAVSELTQAAQGYQAVQTKLLALPTTDQSKFADGLKSMGDQVQQLAEALHGGAGEAAERATWARPSPSSRAARAPRRAVPRRHRRRPARPRPLARPRPRPARPVRLRHPELRAVRPRPAAPQQAAPRQALPRRPAPRRRAARLP